MVVQPPAVPLQDDQHSVIIIGNPGVGKSTTVNCWLGQRLFTAQVSCNGKGVTETLSVHTHGNTRYMDTPGLSDDILRKKAAEAISEALRHGGSFQVIFMLNGAASGRLQADDLTTMKLVLDACDQLGEDAYSVMVNKCSTKFLKKLNEEEWVGNLSACLQKKGAPLTRHVFFAENIDELDEEDDALVELPEETLAFLTDVPTVNVDAPTVRDVDHLAFEDHKQAFEEAKQKAEDEKKRADAEALRAQQAKREAQAANQQAQRAEAGKTAAQKQAAEAETAKNQALTAKNAAESAKSAAESRATTAESAKKAADLAKANAETAKSNAETAKAEAERAKVGAEQRASAASTQAEEEKRKAAEAAKKAEKHAADVRKVKEITKSIAQEMRTEGERHTRSDDDAYTQFAMIGQLKETLLQKWVDQCQGYGAIAYGEYDYLIAELSKSLNAFKESIFGDGLIRRQKGVVASLAPGGSGRAMWRQCPNKYPKDYPVEELRGKHCTMIWLNEGGCSQRRCGVCERNAGDLKYGQQDEKDAFSRWAIGSDSSAFRDARPCGLTFDWDSARPIPDHIVEAFLRVDKLPKDPPPTRGTLEKIEAKLPELKKRARECWF